MLLFRLGDLLCPSLGGRSLRTGLLPLNAGMAGGALLLQRFKTLICLFEFVVSLEFSLHNVNEFHH